MAFFIFKRKIFRKNLPYSIARPISKRTPWHNRKRLRLHLEAHRHTIAHLGKRRRQRIFLVFAIEQSQKQRHQATFSTQYAAVSTIAVSSTPMPRSATTVRRPSLSRISSRHFWNVVR